VRTLAEKSLGTITVKAQRLEPFWELVLDQPLVKVASTFAPLPTTADFLSMLRATTVYVVDSQKLKP
jgi:hypothetical protein